MVGVGLMRRKFFSSSSVGSDKYCDVVQQEPSERDADGQRSSDGSNPAAGAMPAPSINVRFAEFVKDSERDSDDAGPDGTALQVRALPRLGLRGASSPRDDAGAACALWEANRPSPRGLQSLKDNHNAKTWRRVRREALSELLKAKTRESGEFSQDASIANRIRFHMRSRSGMVAPENVDVDHALADLGITSHQFSREVYERVRKENLPNFLKHVRIDPDGGIDRILDVWDASKVFWFWLLMASVIFNVASILVLNWTLTQGYIDNFQYRVKMAARHRSVRMEEFSLNTSHVDAGLAQQDVDIFQTIEEPGSRHTFLSIAMLMATFEVSWIVWALFDCCYQIWLFKREKCEFKSYMSLSYLFQDALPHLSAFSAIALIARVHPSLILQEYQEYISKSPQRRSNTGYAMLTAWFILSRLFLVMVAVSAFGVKVVATGLKLISPLYADRPFVKWAAVVALLNNCMGCVAVSRILLDRLFLFVFAGQDTEYQDDERALRNVYQCRVSREIWKAYAETGEAWGTWRAIVLLATWDHYDLQRLLIEPVEVTPSIASRARSYMNEEGERSPGQRSPGPAGILLSGASP